MIQQRQVLHAKAAWQMENGYSVCRENIFAWSDDNIFSVQNAVNKMKNERIYATLPGEVFESVEIQFKRPKRTCIMFRGAVSFKKGWK